MANCSQLSPANPSCSGPPFSFIEVSPTAAFRDHQVIDEGINTDRWAESKDEVNKMYSKPETLVMQWYLRQVPASAFDAVTFDLLRTNQTTVRNWPNTPMKPPGSRIPVGHLTNETLSGVRDWSTNWTRVVADSEFSMPAASDPRCTEYEQGDGAVDTGSLFVALF